MTAIAARRFSCWFDLAAPDAREHTAQGCWRSVQAFPAAELRADERGFFEMTKWTPVLTFGIILAAPPAAASQVSASSEKATIALVDFFGGAH